MYASSIIGTLHRVDDILERMLALRTYRWDALALVADAIAALEDVGELVSVAVSNVSLEGHSPSPEDDAVAEILTARIDGGIHAEVDGDSVERAQAAGRIDEVAGTTLVPIGRGLPVVRNWWLLAELLVDWLDSLVDGFRRVSDRAAVSAAADVEAAFGTAAGLLAELRDTIDRCWSLGEYLAASVRKGDVHLLETVADLTTVLERNHA